MVTTHLHQTDLFEDVQHLPQGLVYRPGFLRADEEAALVAWFETLPLREARFREYTAKRRVVRFGTADDPQDAYAADDAMPQRDLPPLLRALRDRVGAALGLPAADFVHALVSEYRPGTPIGWHRDAPHFDVVAGISLAGACRMRFRPYAARDARHTRTLTLEPRSIYVMAGDIRWHWQHSIAPVRAARYSITFRTLARDPRAAIAAGMRVRARAGRKTGSRLKRD
jgi:alkylated DNA repair dioxygenase AlkB